MKDSKIRKLVMAALLAALTYVATTVIKIPTPTGGYVHPGDGMVLLSGWLLGPWWGGAAAGIGSMLVDLLGGYASFVPGTLVIKFLDAMAAALVVKALGKGYVSYIVGGVVGEAIMVAGYFAYEGLILGMGMGAAAGIPSNLVQAVTGIVIALVLVALLKGRGVGLCGMDGHMIMCKRKSDVDLGYVGEIEKVNTTLIDHLLADSFIPVIATVGMDDNGVPYNINADTAAAEIAIALHAEKLVSMTDIVGLLYDKNDESTLIPEVEVSEIEGYKAAGIIAGGMLPKIEGMADAIYEGVHEAVIIDGRVPHSILLEMFSDRGAGTMFYRRGNH